MVVNLRKFNAIKVSLTNITKKKDPRHKKTVTWIFFALEKSSYDPRFFMFPRI